jgi:hypothetical protein
MTNLRVDININESVAVVVARGGDGKSQSFREVSEHASRDPDGMLSHVTRAAVISMAPAASPTMTHAMQAGPGRV